jgi:hypothetical protein
MSLRLLLSWLVRCLLRLNNLKPSYAPTTKTIATAPSAKIIYRAGFPSVAGAAACAVAGPVPKLAAGILGRSPAACVLLK